MSTCHICYQLTASFTPVVKEAQGQGHSSCLWTLEGTLCSLHHELLAAMFQKLYTLCQLKA